MTTTERLVYTLYNLRNADLVAIAAAAELSVIECAAGILELDHLGFVDADRLQLTMLGFAAALRIEHRKRQLVPVLHVVTSRTSAGRYASS